MNKELTENFEDMLTEPVPVRREILVTASIHETVTEAEAAIIAAELPVYQRGEKLVLPCSIVVAASGGRETPSAMLMELDISSLRDRMSRAARFQQLDHRKKDGRRDVPPPRDVVEILLNRVGEWKFQHIFGVITTPTMRPDGTIIKDLEYDPATKFYYIADPDLGEITIPEHPTREQALICLDEIKDLLTEFPFKTEVDRAVALSAFLSTVARGAFELAPIHGFSAPVPGSGKSYLVDVIAAATTGRFCPVIAAGKDDVETDKRLTGVLLAG